MKSIDTASRKSAMKSPAQYLAATARSLLLARLAYIKEGQLTIEENGELMTFGQNRNDARIVANIVVKDPSVYSQVLFAGATGAGEAYMANAWESPDLLQVIKVFVANQEALQQINSSWSKVNKFVVSMAERLHRNTLAGSKRNIAAHYDLSNDFFKLFLDESMMYSAAIFETDDTSLSEAAIRKLDHICQRLQLTPDDHLLEIGTGWGGMAIYAAKYYGCRVTTTTISEEQYELACQRVQEEGLNDKITLLKKDYRDLQGQFDKLVTVEMVEAVGHKFYQEFFSRCSGLLKPNGLMLMQAITTTDQRFHQNKNKSDFIRKHIFPGGCLPSNEVILHHTARDTDFHLIGLEDITRDYALTLNHWRQRFFEKIEEVKALGFNDVFIRMWDYYLCFCEGGFDERVIHTAQFLFAKPQCQIVPAKL